MKYTTSKRPVTLRKCINKVAALTGGSTTHVNEIARLLIEAIKDELASGNHVAVWGFGTFQVLHWKNFKSHDYKQMKVVDRKDHIRVSFKPVPPARKYISEGNGVAV